MSAAAAGIFQEALSQPCGLVLVAGPADSDKAATVEAATTLRPDAMSVGAIGDRDTAQRAVQEALAGRMILATIEAEGAVATILRLQALAIEPFLIAATLRGIVAQRLVRRLCRRCRRPVQATAGVAARLGFDPGTVVYAAPGCAACGHQGHRGRIALFEAIAVEPDMRRLIGGGGDAAVIASHAFRDRPDLAGAARAAVREGEIAAEDALGLG